MMNITDVKIAMKCSDVLNRAKEYRRMMKSDNRYYTQYVQQLRLYDTLKNKIGSAPIKEYLGELEKKLTNIDYDNNSLS